MNSSNISPVTNNQNTSSYVAAAKATPKPNFPKKEQATLFHCEESLKLFDYVKAIGKIIGPKNICFASRISNNRICIYLSKIEYVDQLMENNRIIKVEEYDLAIRRLVTPAKRVIISNVCPSIPHNLIEEALKSMELQLVSPITFLRAGIPDDEYNHILSFRRQVYVIPPSESFTLQTSKLINFEENEHRIFFSTDKMECYICKQTGHIAANCPNTNSTRDTEMPLTPTPISSTEVFASTSLLTPQQENLPEPPEATETTVPEESATVLSLKRVLSSSTEQDDPPSPLTHSPSESPQMPPPVAPAKKPAAKHTKKKAKKEDSKMSDHSRQTIEQLYKNDPSSFNIPIQNLLAFLENSHGSNNPLKEAQEITNDIKLLLIDLHIIYQSLSDRSLKNRITRMTKKIRKELNIPELDNNYSESSQEPTEEDCYSDNSQIASGGTSIFVTDNIYSSNILLKTSLEAVAISVWSPYKVAICSLYIPPDYDLALTELIDLIDQLPSPFIIVGDFNAHNKMWGSEKTFGKGKIIESLLNNSSICLLNTGSNTHFNPSTGSFSAIDLSLCDPNLTYRLSWCPFDNLFGSDHYPILITDKNDSQSRKIIKWNITKADWNNYKAHTDEHLAELQLSEDIDEALYRVNHCIVSAAEMYVGTSSSTNKRRSVPWWNDNCHKTVSDSKAALNKYRRTRNAEDLINFKKLRAIARRTLKKSKKDSWRNYVSSITSDTPASEVWRKIKRMNGTKIHNTIPAIILQNTVLNDDQEIANTLADHFQERFKNSNATEYDRMDPSPTTLNHGEVDDHTFLNQPITFHELTNALKKCKNSAAGPDNIPFIFLKKLSEKGLEKLLELFNNIWTNQKFPKLWQKSIILPIHKPDQPPDRANSYRPIALTCTMCKLIEKIITLRLQWFLQKYNIISPNQSGFRPHRCTLDNLASLHDYISEAFNMRQDVIAAIFDIESAFDRLFKHVILNCLSKHHFSGNIYKFVDNFLTNRKFVVNVNGKTSVEMPQVHGLPQGSVLSPILFILAINDISKSIICPVQFGLYADDLIIYCRGKSTKTTSLQIQATIDQLQQWSNNIGLKFSTTKSKIIKFSRRTTSTISPHILLNGVPLPVVETHKILGVIFDSKLTWKEHIVNLKTNCMRKLNILKTLSHTQWDSEEEVLLRLYRTLIRSKLDYGSIIYLSASKTNLKSLDAIHNTGLRLCLGAFRSSPAESIYIEANELPLQLRRQQLLLTYAARVSADAHNPLYPHLFSSVSTVQTPVHNHPLAYTLKSLIPDIDFSNTLPYPIPLTPPWQKSVPPVDTSLSKLPKHVTQSRLIQQKFMQKIEEGSYDIVYFTDASKSDAGLFCSVATENSVLQQYQLPNYASVLTGELYAILKAIKNINTNHHNVAICTDSASSVELIKDRHTQHPIAQNIHDHYQQLINTHHRLTIIWTPSHVGIAGNELADKAAKSASKHLTETPNITTQKDLQALLTSKIQERWQQEWDRNSSKLHDIHPSVKPLKFTISDRRTTVIMRRLRIGHTRYTHGYLMASSAPPLCEHCNTVLTVKHILMDCSFHSANRELHGLQGNLSADLTKPDFSVNIVNFLDSLSIAHCI
ncbi:uncharacterized protein LOC123309578 [Coccinella septempunctata]|uniref:uncharacterized protein LOC123309578 n=1 Tax=Coccinella septempunctata TaxID=41139 RepID=UPI001D05DD44|nr:uncharacterized protein LOC123309578 [Coccinella septempunctata]